MVIVKSYVITEIKNKEADCFETVFEANESPLSSCHSMGILERSQAGSRRPEKPETQAIIFKGTEQRDE